MPPPSPAEPHAHPRAAVDALRDLELDLLTILILEDDANSRTAWTEAASRYGLRRGPSRALTSKDLQPLCTRLMEAEVLPSHGTLFVATPIALHVLTTSQARGRLRPLAEIWERARWQRPRHFSYERHHRTSLRLAVLLGDTGRATDAITGMYGRDRRAMAEFIVGALGREPHAAWLGSLPDDVRVPYLHRLVEDALTELHPLDASLIDAALVETDKKLRLDVARLLTLRGEGRKAAELSLLPRWGPEGIAVLDAFWQGDYATATALGEAAVAAMTGRKHRVLPNMEGTCHMLAAVAHSAVDPRHASELLALLQAAIAAKGAALDVLVPLHDIHAALTGTPHEGQLDFYQLAHARSFVVHMVWMLHELWLHEDPRNPQAPPNVQRERATTLARIWEERARTNGYPPVARELAAIATALAGGPREHLAGAFDPPAPWETALAGLEAAFEGAPAAGTPQAAPTRRLLWQVVISDDDSIELQPRIQASARATKGRSISLDRLVGGDEAELLDDADRAVLAAAVRVPTGWNGRGRIRTLLGRRALVALIDHPRVISSSGAPLTVERGTPKVVSRQQNERIRVELVPQLLLEQDVVCELPEPTRLVVYERPSSLEPLASALARADGLEVPHEARDRLTRILTRVSVATSIAVEGDLELGATLLPADPRPVLQLGWDGATLTVRVRVAPLGPHGPHLHPGAGSASLLGELVGERVGELASDQGPTLARCERDLMLERSRHRALLDACPVLAGFADGPFQHRAPSLPDALDILLEIDALDDDDVRLSWAASQKLDLPLRADLGHFHLKVGSGTNWLSVSATVELDEGAVLGFAELLGRDSGARYIPLGRGRFVALSDKLRRHLDALTSLGTAKGKELRTSPALLTTLDELADEAEHVVFDEAARARLEALRELDRWAPRLPRGFGATLREYQREGYVWMSRLARAGLGACLADDMGLGKTVQTLALLCQRASLGPAAVVCPTSVVLNWVSEATRFAPTLRLHVLAHEADRQQRLRSLGPRDVLVCSYGLLAHEADALAEVVLSTLVFDEAHALKNQATKRAKAARRLRADFRLALTGTPVENHLGELWSLYDVMSPGLLGSRSHFDQRFTTPIGAGDRERTALLRAILRPFLLRRTKAQVLDELPPRSEITIRVEPYPQERAFYEALRRTAWERVASSSSNKARFEILAEITRLRQAAIDPRLVDEVTGPKGAKIDALLERLEQLRDEGHRALVFTQFLGSMAVVRARLAQSGIEHLELDGSTSAAERARRIEAFQAGEGDVFLLSLRAGGVGVNLTGADYVFHLDPWWNPAVEDQATDRAHRIGQQRPVTVYRLVTEGTIEDKIVALHANKRQIADDVLAGLEQATMPDLSELRRLLEL